LGLHKGCGSMKLGFMQPQLQKIYMYSELQAKL